MPTNIASLFTPLARLHASAARQPPYVRARTNISGRRSHVSCTPSCICEESSGSNAFSRLPSSRYATCPFVQRRPGWQPSESYVMSQRLRAFSPIANVPTSEGTEAGQFVRSMVNRNINNRQAAACVCILQRRL